MDAVDLLTRIRSLSQIAVALPREEACRRFELPADRVGHLLVVANDAWTIGTSAGRHDLSGLTEPPRSHGGLGEQMVPLVTNFPVRWGTSTLRNFDAFALALWNEEKGPLFHSSSEPK